MSEGIIRWKCMGHNVQGKLWGMSRGIVWERFGNKLPKENVRENVWGYDRGNMHELCGKTGDT